MAASSLHLFMHSAARARPRPDEEERRLLFSPPLTAPLDVRTDDSEIGV